MNALIPTVNPVTMTSLELVDYINSERIADANSRCTDDVAVLAAELRHDDFLRKVPKVLGEEVARNFAGYYKASNGKQNPMYSFPKREACLMSMSYSYDLQAKVFDRMTELEQRPAFAIPTTLSGALMLAAQQAEQIEQQHAQLAIAAPKAEALDLLTLADGAMCITNAAKSISKRPKDLFAWMQSHDWIYRRPGGSSWCAYQERIKSGLLTHKVTTVSRSDGTEKIVEQVLVTAKGLAKLAEAAA